MKNNPLCPYCLKELKLASVQIKIDGKKVFVGYFQCRCPETEWAIIKKPSDIESRNDK